MYPDESPIVNAQKRRTAKTLVHPSQQNAQIVETQVPESQTPTDFPSSLPQLRPKRHVCERNPRTPGRKSSEEANAGRKRKLAPKLSQRQTRSQAELKKAKISPVDDPELLLKKAVKASQSQRQSTRSNVSLRAKPRVQKAAGTDVVQTELQERIEILKPPANPRVDGPVKTPEPKPLKRKRREIPQSDDLETFMLSAI